MHACQECMNVQRTACSLLRFALDLLSFMDQALPCMTLKQETAHYLHLHLHLQDSGKFVWQMFVWQMVQATWPSGAPVIDNFPNRTRLVLHGESSRCLASQTKAKGQPNQEKLQPTQCAHMRHHRGFKLRQPTRSCLCKEAARNPCPSWRTSTLHSAPRQGGAVNVNDLLAISIYDFDHSGVCLISCCGYCSCSSVTREPPATCSGMR